MGILAQRNRGNSASRAGATLLAAGAALLIASSAPARDARNDNGEPPTLHALVLSSDLIVVGKISRVMMVDRENDLADISYNHTPRFTAVIATIQVDDTLRGDQATTVRFTYPKMPRVSGEPVYDVGADGVWLLRKSDKRDEWVADEQGRLQPRERKEQIRAILNASKASGSTGKKDDDSP